MGIIQEEHEDQESIDKDIQSQETTRPRKLSPWKLAFRVNNLESVISTCKI